MFGFQVQAWTPTWVDPLHAIGIGIVVADSETIVSDIIRSQDGPVHAIYGPIRVKIITPPARVCDNCVG